MKDELWSGKFRMIDDMSEEELSMQLSNERRRFAFPYLVTNFFLANPNNFANFCSLPFIY